MAQTWNTDLLYDLGLAMGQEYADVNNYGVYGPAMNTHRSAFAEETSSTIQKMVYLQ